MIKTAEPSAAWGSSTKGSWLNTANPFSQTLGQTDRIPAWWVNNMFPHSEAGQRAAHITFKAGFDALLAAGLIALYRGINHVGRMADLAKSDNPAHGMKSQLSTTFAGSLDPEKQKKAASLIKAAAAYKYAAHELAQPAIFSAGNALGSAVPIGAVILATSLAYRMTDNYLDKKRNDTLDAAISNKENALKRLIKTRSRLAKGNATDAEVRGALGGTKSDDLYVKQASQDKQAIWPFDAIQEGARMTASGFSALSCLILGAAAIGSYYYFSKADENNIRYRAMQKGLKEYARVKSGYTPVAIIPTKSRKFFADIDQESTAPKKQKTEAPVETSAPAATSVREEQPVLTDVYNKPISLTL
jgi:hypothetical protein